MMGFKPTLYLYKNHKVLFSNIGRNLEPLIELNNFISRYVQNREGLLVHDKVIGKAAAVFLIKINIKKVRADVMSESARVLLEENNVDYQYKKLVPHINNKLESILEEIRDPNDIFNYLLANRLI